MPARTSNLERAVLIPALSEGWKGSFRALLDQARGSGPLSGNPGLAPQASPPLAWQGIRKLRVLRVDREKATVLSLILGATDDAPLAMALPGQFVALRLLTNPDEPPLLRSFSLSGAPSAGQYRLTIKREAHGLGSRYDFDYVGMGTVLDVSAPRGTFLLSGGEGSVVLLSAWVGVTPVLAKLHALAAAGSRREIWWLYGAQNRAEHLFASETREAVRSLPHGHTFVRYSRPEPSNRPEQDYDATGRWTPEAIAALHLPAGADFYLCGPAGFLHDLGTGLARLGVGCDRIPREAFKPGESLIPGIAVAPAIRPHPPLGPAGTGPLISFARSGITIRWSSALKSILELAEACDIPVKSSCRTGGLPYVREWAGFRFGRLHAGTGRTARRGRFAYLLLAASYGYRRRPVNS